MELIQKINTPEPTLAQVIENQKLTSEGINNILQQLMAFQTDMQSSLKTTKALVDNFKRQLNLIDKSKQNFNFMFMFASPNYIVYKHLRSTITSKRSFENLNYNDEFTNIQKRLKQARVQIELHKTHGTIANLKMQLDKLKPRALHFSGHGVTAEHIYNEQMSLKQHTGMTQT